MINKFKMFFSDVRKIRAMHKENVDVLCFRRGIKNNPSDTGVVISLTSHPGRIQFTHRTIRTLLNQTIKPDHIILWLAEEQFPKKEEQLPKELLRLKRFGLEILWCNDIRSYKKLLPTLKLFPEACIITVDDDIYYKRNMVAVLLEENKKHPEEIVSHMINPTFFNGEYFTVVDENEKVGYIGSASYYNKLIGMAGVLYPPHSLYKDIMKESVFMGIAPTNDDMWFWAMATLNRRKTRCPSNPVLPYAITAPEIQQQTGLWAYNNEEDRYRKCMIEILHTYPDILRIIKE